MSNAHECASQWFTYSYSYVKTYCYVRQSCLPPWPNPKLGHLFGTPTCRLHLPAVLHASRNISKQSSPAGPPRTQQVPPSVLPAMVSLVRLPTDVKLRGAIGIGCPRSVAGIEKAAKLDVRLAGV